MDDLISRQAAIDALRTCYDTETVTMDDGDEYINYGDAIGEIEQLPSAQPEQECEKCIFKPFKQFQPERKKGEWIPTRIAKPPKAGQYLVTKQQKTGVCQIATAHYNPSFDEWSGNGNFTKVLAWQQLPTPYIQE